MNAGPALVKLTTIFANSTSSRRMAANPQRHVRRHERLCPLHVDSGRPLRANSRPFADGGNAAVRLPRLRLVRNPKRSQVWASAGLHPMDVGYLQEAQMSQTVAGPWSTRSKRLASGRYSASLPIRLIRSATSCARAKLNGSASATRKGERSRLRARQSSPVGSACVADQPDPAAPISSPAFMRQVAITRRFLRSPGICHASLQGIEYFQATNPNMLFRDVSLYTEIISSPAQAPAIIHEAIAAAYAGRGVAHLTVPMDVLIAKAESSVRASPRSSHDPK